MDCSESGYRDLSKEWRVEEQKLIAKGLIKGSTKLLKVLCRAMKKKYVFSGY
ncbi:MAG: hypothetical protein RDU14_17030 [Melioribacteraceae bacterium]|nr:hypothetical protein [Melioribacteraceae bacterium]